jgi:hypothetical protein
VQLRKNGDKWSAWKHVKDKKTISLPVNYNYQWKITVGDELSQLRMHQYHGYGQYWVYESLTVLQAITPLLEGFQSHGYVTRGLTWQGVLFLSIDVLVVLWWFPPTNSIRAWMEMDLRKRNYQTLLAILVLGEVKHSLYYAFMKETLESLGSTFAVEYSECPKAFLVFIGILFIKWIEHKTRESMDKIFRVSLLYLLQGYHKCLVLYRQSLHCIWACK